MRKDKIRDTVRQYYGKAASLRASCCDGNPAPSCCDKGEAPASSGIDIFERLGYSAKDVIDFHGETAVGFSSGNPLAIAGLKVGETVLDLGSGTGFDCYLAAKQVGEKGRVIGVDMTPEMLNRAHKNLAKWDFKNVEFRLGEIEHLPVADSSVDVVMSNCVINLSPEKTQVFAEAFRVLRPGGRLAISDIVALSPLPEKIKNNMDLYCGCLSGAASIEELKSILHNTGFRQIRITPKQESGEIIDEWTPSKNFQAFVISATIEAVKPRSIKKQNKPTADSKPYFNEVASEWDQMRQSFFSEAVRNKSIAMAKVKKGKLAADIGAGTGFITEGLIQKELQVIAIDQSDAMLMEMKKKFAHINGIDYRQGNAEKLPIADHTVDYAFANMYLHHVESPAKAIKEMARIIKSGGKLVITDLDEHPHQFLKAEHHDRWMGFLRDDVRKWFVDAGFQNVTVNDVSECCCSQSCCGDEKVSISIFIAFGEKVDK